METNYRRGEVMVEFGSDARLIRYDCNAICILEQNLDKSLYEIMKSIGYNSTREALFVGLRHKGNKKLTRADVGNMMGSGDESLEYYTAAVFEAFQGATGKNLSKPIRVLRAADMKARAMADDGDDEDEDEDEDEKVEGCDGPDAGNA